MNGTQNHWLLSWCLLLRNISTLQYWLPNMVNKYFTSQSELLYHSNSGLSEKQWSCGHLNQLCVQTGWVKPNHLYLQTVGGQLRLERGRGWSLTSPSTIGGSQGDPPVSGQRRDATETATESVRLLDRSTQTTAQAFNVAHSKQTTFWDATSERREPLYCVTDRSTQAFSL